MDSKKKVILGIGIALTISFFLGCANMSSMYRQAFKGKLSYNSQIFPVSQETLSTAVQRVLLSQNFTIERKKREKGIIQAKKHFQKGKKTITLSLQAVIDSEGENQQVLFTNAVQKIETLYVKSHTRFFLWLIPLPGGGGEESEKIIEEEKTIEDRRFYRDFFKAIDKEIKDLPIREEKTEKDENGEQDIL
ncbi:MAG: DUF2242 domain-containing protein [Candidatus Omnitrophica bacterium]|nr:DUF2242 domain-containing protein [Candidatus Omnitrophota bacterium]